MLVQYAAAPAKCPHRMAQSLTPLCHWNVMRTDQFGDAHVSVSIVILFHFLCKWWSRPHVFDEKWKNKNQKCRRTESALSPGSSIDIETQRYNVYLGVSNVTIAWHGRPVYASNYICRHHFVFIHNETFPFNLWWVIEKWWCCAIILIIIELYFFKHLQTCRCVYAHATAWAQTNHGSGKQTKMWEMQNAHISTVSTSSRTRNTKHCCQQRLNLMRVVTQAAARLAVLRLHLITR